MILISKLWLENSNHTMTVQVCYAFDQADGEINQVNKSGA